jgi:hypothetical protein
MPNGLGIGGAGSRETGRVWKGFFEMGLQEPFMAAQLRRSRTSGLWSGSQLIGGTLAAKFVDERHLGSMVVATVKHRVD